MAQHFLLSPESRNLSLSTISQMSNAEARELMIHIRWGSADKVCCPRCNSQVHNIKCRHQWRCKSVGCKYTFSVTSGTIFASYKLPLRTYLLEIYFYINDVNGMASLNLSRNINTSYKTALILTHKLRDSLMKHRDLSKISGNVQIDCYDIKTGKNYRLEKERKIKSDNQIPKANDDRKICQEEWNDDKKYDIPNITNNQKKIEKRKVIAITTEGKNKRTLVFPVSSENKEIASYLINKYVAQGSVICTDGARCYNFLDKTEKYTHQTVIHSKKEYVNKEKYTTNNVENFFSRVKRLENRVIRVNHYHLWAYMNEIAYHHTHRRFTQLELFGDVLHKALHTKTSDFWKGYYQPGYVVRDEMVF